MEYGSLVVNLECTYSERDKQKAKWGVQLAGRSLNWNRLDRLDRTLQTDPHGPA